MNMLSTTELVNELEHKVVRLKGRLDADAVDRRKTELTNRIMKDGCDIVLNVSEISFIDSTGLGFLVSLQQQMQANGDKLVLCELSDQARMLFELTRLNQIFDIFDSETAALQAV